MTRAPALALALLLACGGEPIDLPPSVLPELPSPAIDPVVAPIPPTPPDEPAPPAVAIIESGWIEEDPLPDCPESDWPPFPAHGPIYFVKAFSAAGADGTRDRPFNTITEATDAALGGPATIIVGRGLYPELVVLRDGVELIGLCPRRTILDGAYTDGTVRTLRAVGHDCAVSRVTLRGYSEVRNDDLFGASIRFDQVAFEPSMRATVLDVDLYTEVRVDRSVMRGGGHGFEVFGSLTLDRSIITGTAHPVRAEGAQARVRISRSRFEDLVLVEEDKPPIAVATIGSSVVEVSESLFARLDAAVFGATGTVSVSEVAMHDVQNGVFVGAGSFARMRRSFITGASRFAVVALGSTVHLEDSTFDRSGAVVFTEGARGRADRIAITGPRAAALQVTMAAELRAVDVRIDDPTKQEPNGILVSRGSTLSAERLAIINADFGSISGAQLHLEDLIVDGGSMFIFNSTLRMERARLSRYRGYGALASKGSALTVADLRIEEAEQGEAELFDGVALIVFDAEAASFERIAIVGARGLGMGLTDSSVTMRDLSIRDVKTQGRGELGYGVWLLGGSLELERAEFLRAHLVSIEAWSGAAISGREVRIEDTDSSVCTVDSCAFEGEAVGGIGISALEESTVSLSRFEIRSSRLAGAQAVEGSTLRLEEGIIADNEIGIHGVAPLEATVFTTGVLFLQNRANIDTAGNVFVPPTITLPEIIQPPDP